MMEREFYDAEEYLGWKGLYYTPLGEGPIHFSVESSEPDAWAATMPPGYHLVWGSRGQDESLTVYARCLGRRGGVLLTMKPTDDNTQQKASEPSKER